MNESSNDLLVRRDQTKLFEISKKILIFKVIRLVCMIAKQLKGELSFLFVDFSFS